MSHQHPVYHESWTRSLHVAVLALLASVLGGLNVQPAAAQTKKAPAKGPAEQKFEDTTLTTKDGVFLRCTYYKGPETKQTVPIILVHDWDSRRGELHQLALYLQRMEYAVLVPDLRGHGNSVQVENSDTALDRGKMRRPAIEAMVLDIEAAKTFLLKENNAGKLNIELLGVLGTGFGASLALNWAIHDWNVPNLRSYKMGQDVKALVLISPQRSFKGTTINPALKDLRVLAQLSALVVVGGEESTVLKDAERVHQAFARAWGADNSEAVQALPFFAAETSLQATALINTPGTGVDRWIAAFLDQRLKRQQERFPWADRTSPLQ